MNFIKIIINTTLVVLFPTILAAQIESKDKIEVVLPTSNSMDRQLNPDFSIHFGAGFGQSFRTLKTKEGLFAKDLGLRADERALAMSQYELGATFRLEKQLFINFTASYSQYGEQYSFEQGTDSSYTYTTKYTSFSVPIGIQYRSEGQFRFYGGLGLQPSMITTRVNTLDIKDSNSKETTTNDKSRDNLNLMQMWTYAQIGAQIQLSPKTSFYASPEFKYQMTNTYHKQAGLSQHAYYWNIRFGFMIAL